MMPCVALPMISPWRICRLRQPTATSWRSPFVLRKHRTARLLTELIGFHLRKVGQRCPASMSGRCRSVVPAFRAREGEGMAACREPRGDGPSGRGYRQPLADDRGGVRGLDRRWPADHAGHDVRSADCGVLQPHRQHLRAAVPDVGTGGAVPCRCRGAGTSQADLRRVRVVPPGCRLGRIRIRIQDNRRQRALACMSSPTGTPASTHGSRRPTGCKLRGFR